MDSEHKRTQFFLSDKRSFLNINQIQEARCLFIVGHICSKKESNSEENQLPVGMKQSHYVDHCLPGKTATTTSHNRTLHCEMTCKFYKAYNISSFRDSRCLKFACCWSCE